MKMSKKDLPKSALRIQDSQVMANWPENTSRALLKPLPWTDYCWRLSGTSWLTEAFNYYFLTEDGASVFLQTAYSNLAWPNCTCSVMVRYYRPADQKMYCWQHTCLSVRMKCNKKNSSVQVKDTSIEFKPGNDKEFPMYLLAHENEEFKLVLEFNPTEQPIQVGNGETRFGENGTEGYLLFQFIPSGTVNGYIQSKSESIPIIGRGISVHQFQGVRPNIASKRFDVLYFSQVTNKNPAERDYDLMMVQFQTPPKYGSHYVNVGFVTCKGALVAMCTGSAIVSNNNATVDKDNGYRLPQEMEFKWNGFNLDGQKFSVIGLFKPQEPFAKINVLEKLPYFIKKAIELLVARPFIYKWMDKCEFKLQIDHEPEKLLKGSIYYEISFLKNE